MEGEVELEKHTNPPPQKKNLVSDKNMGFCLYMLTLESRCILDVLISKTLPSCKSTTRGYSYQVYFKEQKLLKLQTHHNSWQSCVSCELRLIIYLGAFTILSVHKLKFKGVCFRAKQAQLYRCMMLIFGHVDLFYVWVNSIILYTLWYYIYSKHDCFTYTRWWGTAPEMQLSTKCE